MFGSRGEGTILTVSLGKRLNKGADLSICQAIKFMGDIPSSEIKTSRQTSSDWC